MLRLIVRWMSEVIALCMAQAVVLLTILVSGGLATANQL